MSPQRLTKQLKCIKHIDLQSILNVHLLLADHMKHSLELGVIIRTEQNMIFISTWAYIYNSSLQTKHLYIACTKLMILYEIWKSCDVRM